MGIWNNWRKRKEEHVNARGDVLQNVRGYFPSIRQSVLLRRPKRTNGPTDRDALFLRPMVRLKMADIICEVDKSNR